MANFNQIEEERKLLGLGKAATLKEMKKLTEHWLIATTPISLAEMIAPKAKQ